MKKENLKHLILVIVAVCLIGIGYLNYDYEPTIEVAAMDNQIDETTLRRCRVGKCQHSQSRDCAK